MIFHVETFKLKKPTDLFVHEDEFRRLIILKEGRDPWFTKITIIPDDKTQTVKVTFEDYKHE